MIFWIPKALVEKKNTSTLNYARQTNRETKRNQSNKKDKMLLLFNKISKGWVLDKSRNLVAKVVKISYKGSFITEGCFLFFW